jgi:2'-5' RNA ligase
VKKYEINKRLFFALWPDDKIRSELVNAFKLSDFSESGGQNFQPDNLHLTLHFLGNVSQQKFNCVMDIAAQLEFESFELELNQFSVFEKAKIFYLGMTDTSDELITLQANLGVLLAGCDFQAESRAFTPHVTLKRKIQQFDVSEIPQKICWRVERFALVESVSVEGGVMYKPLKYFTCCKV